MFAEVLEAWEDPDGLADEAFYDNRKTIFGYFDADYAEAAFSPVGVQSSRPVFDCWAVRVDDAPAGQTLEVMGRNFVIVRSEPHSSGRVRLVLREV